MKLLRVAIALPVVLVAIAGSLPASAATTSQCLSSMSRLPAMGKETGFVGVTLSPNHRDVVPNFRINPALCQGAVFAIGISRRDGSQFRNANATYDRSTGWVRATHRLGWADTGDWTIRQIAVSWNGQGAVRLLDPAKQSSVARVKRASVLTAYPTGRFTADKNNVLQVGGYLKAYNSKGGLSPLPGQLVELQGRRYGWELEYGVMNDFVTKSTGRWGAGIDFGFKYPQQIRVIFRSRYQTIANDFTYMGVGTGHP